jgi:cell wall assembly regulator SMI1
MARDVGAIWDRIAAHATLPLELRPGASEAAIRAAEQVIGRWFPDDFRASLALYDGQRYSDDADAFEWLPGHDRLVPLEAIVEAWRDDVKTFTKMYVDPPEPAEVIADGELYHYLWHPQRITIAGNRWFDQDNTYLDYFPGPRGRAGQLAGFGKGDFGSVHGPSFGAALETYANALDRGDYIVRADGAVVPGKKWIKNWSAYIAKRAPAP